jgi:hypothetical protein
LGHIFTKYGGFAEKVEDGAPEMAGKSFVERIDAELSKENAQRVTTRKEYRDGEFKIQSDLVHRLFKRTGDEDDGVSGYLGWLVLDLAPFIRNQGVLLNILTENKFIMEGLGVGAWLNLPD